MSERARLLELYKGGIHPSPLRYWAKENGDVVVAEQFRGVFRFFGFSILTLTLCWLAGGGTIAYALLAGLPAAGLIFAGFLQSPATFEFVEKYEALCRMLGLTPAELAQLSDEELRRKAQEIVMVNRETHTGLLQMQGIMGRDFGLLDPQ